MTYNFLKNGCRDGFRRYKWSQCGIGEGQSSLAIDELGRLFAWGQNYDHQCGIFPTAALDFGTYSLTGMPPLYDDIEVPTRILLKHKRFIKCGSNEFGQFALTDEGEMYGWGWASEDCSAFGLPVGSGIDSSNEYFSEPVLCTPGYRWKDIANDMYSTIGIDLDGNVYGWGDNFDWNITNEYTINLIFNTPQRLNLVPGPCKFVDSRLGPKVVVTEDNRVFAWGDSWWNTESGWDFYFNGTPTQITGLPAGSVITFMAACADGIYVVLSDGSLWAAGGSILFGEGYDPDGPYPHGTQTFQEVTFFSDKPVAKVRPVSMGGFVVYVITQDGDVYQVNTDYGSALYSCGSSHWAATYAYCYFWQPVGVETLGDKKFVDAMPNTHQNSFMAIGEDGYLYTWGSQWWGPHLGNNTCWGYTDLAKNPQCSGIIQVQPIIGYASEAEQVDGEPTYLNVFSLGESPYI